MTIYIGCIKAGVRAGQPVSALRWANKLEFYYYCDEILATRDERVFKSMSIDQLCDAINDVAFGGIGSRYYRRIARPEALAILME